MGGFVIAGVPAAIVIVTLVEVLKRAGLERRFAPLAAIVLGVMTTLAVQLAMHWPWLRAWWEAIGSGVLLGLSASGLYSGSKAMIVRRGGGGRYRETAGGDVVEATARMLPPRKGGSASGQ